MADHSVLKGIALGLIALGLLAGCARPTGDFGRAAPSVLHDTILPQAGQSAAGARGEPVSDFNLTDQEREMHDRVWRFLVAAHADDWFYDTAVELQRTRVTGVTDTSFTIDRYYRHLHETDYASSRVRFSRVEADVRADIATLPTTFDSICAVIGIDRQRQEAVMSIAGVGDAERADVAARQYENAIRIDWFVRALRYRFDAYGYALDRLLVETPHEEAYDVDAALSVMAGFVSTAERRDFCSGGGGASGFGDIAIPSRLESQPFTPEPLGRK